MDEPANSGHRIVVGIDGSSSSNAALEWAAQQAELTSATIGTVTTWQWPQSYGYPMPIAPDYSPAADGEKVIRETVEEGAKGSPRRSHRNPRCRGPPAQVLVERSEGPHCLLSGAEATASLQACFWDQ